MRNSTNIQRFTLELCKSKLEFLTSVYGEIGTSAEYHTFSVCIKMKLCILMKGGPKHEEWQKFYINCYIRAMGTKIGFLTLK